ncbi:MAG TPA: hypothetical protein VLB04_01865 [Methanotrichaceae archaeon]|nr:hypothetical protein [Methanotrichaceae archaeon]
MTALSAIGTSFGKLLPSLAGTPWQEEYSRIAPHPEDWPTLT